ncbi:MAG: phenylalanyl-tRNA synthetase subunit beta [Pseudomonadota bacterium]
MARSHKIILAILVTAILVAHVFLWMSEMPTGAKLTFTLLNAVAWSLVLVPIWLVPRWLDAIQRRTAGE